ncbi:MAG: hypothetical protein GF311_25125 [Candidatus Lokiarchaeota archaeon]|nr:hypothetical protein [Candidatus Lokiarchaeota archaeon]
MSFTRLSISPNVIITQLGPKKGEIVMKYYSEERMRDTREKIEREFF